MPWTRLAGLAAMCTIPTIMAMERSKGGQVALSFDSDQGGETADDHGYIPVLSNLVSGRLHFLLSPEGRMLRFGTSGT